MFFNLPCNQIGQLFRLAHQSCGMGIENINKRLRLALCCANLGVGIPANSASKREPKRYDECHAWQVISAS
ncbi:hypothetical protein D8I24_2797 (plasmid) [Cupriavidus necator H850]|nr:hypothetical protein D8I24_2797 [Cupriavidus necator H850]